MSSLKKWIRLGGVLSPLLLSIAFVACGDDANDAPPDNPKPIGSGGKKGDAGASGGKSSGSGGKSSGSGGDVPDSSAGGSGSGGEEGSGGEQGSGGEEGSGGSGPIVPDSGTCTPGETGEHGCFKCPKTTAEYHNQCTSSSCSPFDNEARLPRFDGYPLPALQ
jgi:hypothetical protein